MFILPKASFIRFFSVLLISFTAIGHAKPQENPILEPDIVGQLPLVLSLEQNIERTDQDLLFHNIQNLRVENLSLNIRHAERLYDEANSIILDFTYDKLNWISVMPIALMSELDDGFFLDARQNKQYLYFNYAPQAIGTIEEMLENFETQEGFLEGDLIAPDVVDDEFMPQVFAEENVRPIKNNSKLIVNINRSTLWQSYPNKLIGQLIHLGVDAVIITIPSSYNGSFPSNPIKLEKFITLASAEHIDVFAAVEEDFVKLDNGASKSQAKLSEFSNYNKYVGSSAKLAGVQIQIAWFEIENFVFDESNWFLRTTDLYASLAMSEKNLAVDLLLPEEIISELGNDSIFKRLEKVADSITVQVWSDEVKKIEGLLAPLQAWSDESEKTYRVAIEKRDPELNVTGWLHPDVSGNVRMFVLDEWAVLMKVDGANSNIGMGFNLNESDLSDVNSGYIGLSKLFFTSSTLSLAEDIEASQSQNRSFMGITLYGLPEFSE